ncbi:hypothetical protein, partial [Acidithiobacillus concretivorus]|uniref:hypothetical protein n=1 Tax=Acidithiobacillus concretivorus TaxID=3063952 RepID=UPI001C0709BC
SCARQESCLSPKGEFSPDSRMSLRTTGKGRWRKKPPRPLPFLWELQITSKEVKFGLVLIGVLGAY